MKRFKGHFRCGEEGTSIQHLPAEPSKNLEGQAEQTLPSSSFPADTVREIWLNIFEKLDNLDKITFSRACSEWHDWLAAKKTQLHIPEVTPTIIDDIPEKVIFPIRLLNRSLTLELDKELGSHASHLELDFESPDYDAFQINKLVFTFTTSKDIKKFMEDMENHPGNPFMSRSLEFNGPHGDRHSCCGGRRRGEKTLCRKYWKDVILMLDQFGEHIHFVTISFRGTDILGKENLVHLRNILLKLPNLRRLNLLGWTKDEDSIGNSFPQLNSLESLSIYDIGEGEDVNMNDIVLNSCCVPAKIKRFFILNCDTIILPEVLYRFCNLEVLEAAIQLGDLERLGNLEEKPPLQKLCLDRGGNMWVKYYQIFQALESFGSTLVHLEMKDDFYLRKYEERVFNLPNLKKLVFGSYGGGLDLLLQFKKLSYLGFYDYEAITREVNAGLYKVDLYEFKESVYESNIWRLMPSLNVLVWDEETYKRCFYERGPPQGLKRE